MAEPVDLSSEPGVPVDLHDDGVLWMINRALLHPRGFALGHDPKTNEFVLYGDGTEVWSFGPMKEDDFFTRFEALLQRAVDNQGAGTEPVEPTS